MKSLYIHVKNDEPIHILAHEDIIQISSKNGINVGDVYHTMDELYDHQLALNAALFNYTWSIQLMFERNGYRKQKPWVVKSKLHNDGTIFEGGYFIVAGLFDGKQISYHYKLEHWDKFKISEVEQIPWEYDGHTPKDCIERLLSL